MQSIMDQNYDISDKAREQAIAAKQRFESFKMGPGMPPACLSLSKPAHGRTHSRSHSRNTSVNSLSSMSNLPISLSAPCVKTTNDMSTAAPPKQQRPTSHHRRRSSVSTRRESAEMMGVSVPDLPTSKSEDNINLGDKDSIRRRALWALEGKPDVSYSKVEIPELASPVKEAFAFPTMPSYPAGAGAAFGSGLNNLAGKRDSMGKYPGSASSKDQLQTLVEEEEEEEETIERAEDRTFMVTSPVEDLAPTTLTPTVAVTKPSPARPRPASLNLRPLALTTGSVVSPSYNGLPTPTLTPGNRSGLKALALGSSPNFTHTSFTNNNNNNDNLSTTIMRRQSLNLTPSPSPASAIVHRRPSLNINCDSPSSSSLDGTRRSSISYKSSSDVVRRSAGLPTPAMTPVIADRAEHRWSADDQPAPNTRPLSASEQHFLFKSHNALLARITDLENALSSRSRPQSRQRHSRPASMASDASSNAPSELSDEMLSLITDLKAERDELKRDVDGWRTRVADLEDKVCVFTKRVDAERMEAWVARSRLALLEPEKSALEAALQEKNASFQEALQKLDAAVVERDVLKADNGRLLEQARRCDEVEAECARLRVLLAEETRKREELESAEMLVTPTPETPSGRSRHWFQSMDSEASLTDVESLDDSFIKGTTLKAVVEEEDEAYEDYDDDNGLAGYEDEDESDMSFNSPGSSVGSMDEYTRRALHLNIPCTPSLIVSDTSSDSASPTLPIITPPVARHAPSNSLSRTWTFPSSGVPNSAIRNEHEEIDRFFGCLDDLDNSPPVGFMSEDYNGKSLFSQAFASDADDDDEMPPFVLPNHVGVEEKPAPVRLLDVVMEEEEEESIDEEFDESFEGEEFEGGIRFTFNGPSTPIVSVTPPTDTMLAEESLPRAISRKPVPVFVPFDEEEDEADVPFTFSAFKSQEPANMSLSSSSTDESDADISISVRTFSPSSIPRATALKSFTSSYATTPTKSGRPASAYMTPPSKRGGIMPSFIPQPVSSPLKNSAPAKPKGASMFMRQPQKKPISSATNVNAPPSEPSSMSQTHVPSSLSTLPHPIVTPPLEQDLFSTPASFALSLQTFTNWWSPAPSVSTVTSCMSESSSSSVDLTMGWSARQPKGPIEKKYVSKEKQLEKLRHRLDQERKIDCRGYFQVDVCKACGTGEVFL